MAQQELDLLQLSTGSMAQLRTRAPQVVGRDGPEAEFASILLTTCQTRRSVTPSPHHLPARQTQRNSLPVWSSAAPAQSSTAVLTQHGTGTVRMCPPLRTRSNNRPMLLSLLQMREVQISQFPSPQPAAKQHCENGAVPFAFEPVGIGSLPNLAREPVPKPHA